MIKPPEVQIADTLAQLAKLPDDPSLSPAKRKSAVQRILSDGAVLRLLDFAEVPGRRAVAGYVLAHPDYFGATANNSAKKVIGDLQDLTELISSWFNPDAEPEDRPELERYLKLFVPRHLATA
jgi:hypothetical protein